MKIPLLRCNSGGSRQQLCRRARAHLRHRVQWITPHQPPGSQLLVPLWFCAFDFALDFGSVEGRMPLNPWVSNEILSWELKKRRPFLSWFLREDPQIWRAILIVFSLFLPSRRASVQFVILCPRPSGRKLRMPSFRESRAWQFYEMLVVLKECISKNLHQPETNCHWLSFRTILIPSVCFAFVIFFI